MTMKDVEKMCCCKYAKWENGSGESTTAWIECRLKMRSLIPITARNARNVKGRLIMNELRGLWRGKEVAFGEWVDGDLVCDKYFDGSMSYFIFERDFDNSKSYTIDPSTFGECTGLRDKNGTPIFEGDIVKTKRQIGTVIYDDDNANFTVETNQSYIPMAFSDEFEVIGNIHDNPELLKSGKESNNG